MIGAGYLAPSLAETRTSSAVPPVKLVSSEKPLAESFATSARAIHEGGPAKLLLDVDRRKEGAFTLSASAIVYDDRGKIVVAEEVAPPTDLPPPAMGKKYAFELPALPDGFYRAELLAGWHQDNVESSVEVEDMYLRVEKGTLREEDPTKWARESMVLFATKKGE
jgi:hypothetical protein